MATKILTIENYTSFEPKLRNRYVVDFHKPFSFPQYMVKSTTRPVLNVKENEWEDMVFEFYDAINPSVSEDIMNGIRKLRTQLSQEFTITMNLLGPVGDVIEEWDIRGEIEKVEFGELDYSVAEALTLKVYFKVNHCELEF